MAKFKDLNVDETKNDSGRGGFNEFKELDTSTIKDNSVINETSMNKMATSIPTPFARLFLYDTAFFELNKREEVAKGKAYKVDNGSVSLYHHLAAECLDMLEFIFEYGQDPLFTIHEWDVKKDTEMLGVLGDEKLSEDADSDQKRHFNLGKALKSAIKLTDLKVLDKIFIFKWDGIIIGGTSPFTLVYASPNWRKKMRERNLSFFGGNGNKLFPLVGAGEKVCSLSERSEDFRLFMYRLQNMFSNKFNSKDGDKEGPLWNLSIYLRNCQNTYDNSNVKNEFEEKKGADLVVDYDSLKLSSTEGTTPNRPLSAEKVAVLDIPFFVKKADIEKKSAESGYRIKPTVIEELLPVEVWYGEPIHMKDKLPLVLNRAVLPGARYWGNTPYKPDLLDVMPEEEYYKRRLPGVAGRPVYPYLTECDFFEDKIIYVGYKLNRECFTTCTSVFCKFLLPLKPTFFKYFNTIDLEKLVKLTVAPTNNEQEVPSHVVVDITIPVVGGEVKFSKVYRAEQFVNFPNEGGAFKLGIFPFYAYADEYAYLNAYKVLLASNGEEKVDLEFYNEDFVSPLSSNVTCKERTKNAGVTTEYYSLGTSLQNYEDKGKNTSGTFTAIRVMKNGIGGMVIPKFPKPKVSTDKYAFCVDFGTVNTNIAYAKIVDGLKPHEIQTLEFDTKKTGNGAHVVMLDEKNKQKDPDDKNKQKDPDDKNKQKDPEYDNYINSEFIPETIGEGAAKFPTRTILCRKKANIHPIQPLDLFGEANIAFLSDTDDKDKDCYEFESNLKWNNANRSLNTTFFCEIMWMCKNKVAELGGDPNFQFYFTFPQSMKPDHMERGWKEAALLVRTKATISSKSGSMNLSESLAPWFYAYADENSTLNLTDSFINIDIGGGSTDIIYRPNGATSFTMSVKFAANDLWGDGIQSANKALTNGFLGAYQKKYIDPVNKLEEAIRESYRKFKAIHRNSADVVSYLFSKKEFLMGHFLETDDTVGKKLRLPLLMHFAAIVYYTANILNRLSLNKPKHITFSGMGSLYLKLIAPDEDTLSNIINAIFRFAELDYPKEPCFDTKLADNPKEITAKGGVLMGCIKEYIKTEKLHIYLIDKEEDDLDITLADIKKSDNKNEKNPYEIATIAEAKKFLQLFKDKDFRASLEDNINLHFDEDTIVGYFDEGFNEARRKEEDANRDSSSDSIEDTLFFWPIKQAIYRIAREISQEFSPKGKN